MINIQKTLRFFATKKPKIIKPQKKKLSLEDQLLQMKKSSKPTPQKSSQNPSIYSQKQQQQNQYQQPKKPINQIDFTELSSETQIVSEYLEQKDIKIDQNFEFPWDFQHNNKLWPTEENVKSIIDIGRIINEPQAISIYKDFIEDVSTFNYSGLEDTLERSFFRKIKKQLKELERQNCKIKCTNLDKKVKSIELFKVQNLFAVGLTLNRRKNEGFDNFIVNDDYLQNRIPCRFYIKRRIGQNELAKIVIQLNLAFMSQISMNVVQEKDQQQNILLQDAFSTQNPEDIQQGTIHKMILEAEMIECDYKQLKKIIESGQEFNQSNMKNFKNKMNNLELQIIDFDGFMKGNDIARQRHDPAL